MKYFIVFICFICTTLGFSQSEQTTFKDKFEEFDYYAKPNPYNDLSKYFRNRIDSNLLNDYKINKTDIKENIIFLTFRLTNDYKVESVKVYSTNSELNTRITEIFNHYDIDKLNIPIKSPLYTYALQILSQEGDQLGVNCSTNIIYDTLPIYEGCETATNYSQMKTSINKLLEAHIANTISLAVIQKAKVLGSFSLKPEFIINERGAIELLPKSSPPDSLAIEINRVLTLFPVAKTPPLRNGHPTRLNYKGSVRLLIDSDSEKYKKETNKVVDTTLNPNCDLALHFKKYINESELMGNVFPLSKESVEISFGIDKKGKMIDITASTGNNPVLNNRLITIFKSYPFEKLNINSTNVLATYKYTIITKGVPMNVIQCNVTPNVYIPPYFDKTCENSNSSAEIMKCFAEKTMQYFSNNMGNSYFLKHTEFTKSFTLVCEFKVDTDAKIIDVRVQTPDPNLANDMEKIIKNIDSVYKPAYLNGKPVKYTHYFAVRVNVGN
jgi:hypothetical protein